MKCLKSIIVFAAVLSLSPAYAQTATLGHISASVVGALNVTEVFPIKFGNFAITCTSGACDAQSTIVLSDQGLRTATSAGADTIALLNGGGGGTNLETGAQSPGFYHLDAGGEGSGTQHVYVSFADANGNIIDVNHPANHVSLSGPVANAFTVDAFTFESDTGTTGSIQQNPSVTDIYGTYVPLVNGTATLRVGATLHTAAGPTPTPGQYTGTFNVMVSF
jgi:hypothetical protein